MSIVNDSLHEDLHIFMSTSLGTLILALKFQKSCKEIQNLLNTQSVL
jgi:hypothetical protein